MKKQYENPALSLLEYQQCNVISTSNYDEPVQIPDEDGVVWGE